MDILIKNMEMPSCCEECWMTYEGDSENCPVVNESVVKYMVEETRHPHCPLIPVVHCKECENFNKETDICTLWGSWTNEDGFCHKAVVLERTT